MRAEGGCQGCPGDSGEPVRLYRARFDGGPWEFVRYCDTCAELAEANYNGSTDAIEPAFDSGRARSSR